MQSALLFPWIPAAHAFQAVSGKCMSCHSPAPTVSEVSLDPAPTADLVAFEIDGGAPTRHIMDSWMKVNTRKPMMTIVATAVSVVGAESVTVNGDINIVVPAVLCLAVTLAGELGVRVSHGEINGGLGHAPVDSTLADHALVFRA